MSSGKEMGFLDHLEELRWHLVRALLAIVVIAIAAFVFKDIIFNEVLLAPKNPEFFTNKKLCELAVLTKLPNLCINTEPFQLISIKMAGQLMTHVWVSLFVGLILGFPYVFGEFWSFIKPALYDRELKHTRGAVL